MDARFRFPRLGGGPGLWRPLRDGEAPPSADIEIEAETRLPDNMVGDWVVHSSADPVPVADASPATDVTAMFTVRAAGQHMTDAASPAWHRIADSLAAWNEAFRPFRVTAFFAERDRVEASC
jgi:hypothetical protein